ncbi:predicted protein [Nematostella vectensis]|uniref:G-protein coupled receptors family 1 profile domain-containing protein n=1 Tax=Nematostella vectensis TaxID=45351 RepID=A7SB08_NEMVE|nr:predicted protein [Nematostella vectensis]|eukprot:XP_001631141.1 predicted protein [Nematostella vectensis]
MTRNRSALGAQGNLTSVVGMETYMQVELASAAILIFLCPVTIAANSLLLTAIYRDPLRTFRTPTTFFIIGLACSDLVTAVAVEPFFAMNYIAHYIECGPVIDCEPSKVFLVLHRVGGIISTIAISTSFLVVLALSVSQYIAVTYPHKYKDLITRSRVVWCVAFSYIYFIAFSLLQFTGLDTYTYLQIDLVLHPTLISIVLAVVHSLLYMSFRRHLNRRNTLKRRSTPHKREKSDRRLNREKTRQSDRQFTIVTFYLAGILLASASLHTIILYVYFYHKERSHQANVDIHICLRISDLLLFLKVMLDPFIYAWRLPAYRKALKITLISTQQRLRPHKYKTDGLSTVHESKKIMDSALN